MSSGYFRLIEYGPELAYVRPVVSCMIPLNLGISIKAFSIPDNLTFDVERLTDDPIGCFYPDYYLMNQPLVKLPQDAGVENLELYPTKVIDKKSGQVLDYWTFNIVGSVECADLGQSESLPIGGAKHFQKLAIDPAKAPQLLLFRLQDSMSDIIVNASIAEKLTAAKFFGVALAPVSAD